MSFQQVVAASLPDVTNPRTIWAKDGLRWHSSLDVISASRDRSSSFESSRVAGGSSGPSLSLSYREEHAPNLNLLPELRPFDAFLEEEGILHPPSLSPNDGDKDVVYIPGSKAQPIILDTDDVAISENDHLPDIDMKYLDRYSSDESDERATSPEEVDDVWDNANPTSRSESLGNPDEDIDDVVLAELHSLRPTDGSPSKPISLTLDVSSPSPSVQTVPLVPNPVQTVPLAPQTVQTIPQAIPSEDSDADSFTQYLEQNIDVSVTPTHEPATSSGNFDWDVFGDYLEQNIARDSCAKENIAEKHGAKRNIDGKHGAKRSTAGNRVVKQITAGNEGVKRSTAGSEAAKRSTAENHGAKRRRLNPPPKGGANPKFLFPEFGTKGRLRKKLSPRAILQQAEHLRSKKTVKEQATVLPSEYLEPVSATLDSSPVNGGKILDKFATTDLEYADELEGLLVEESRPESVRAILDRSKEVSKSGRPPQVIIQLVIVCQYELGPLFGANS